ncbi:hypothetical protein GOBAR_AA07131 [Gossypium barbadense]|uniref:Uncharacterized protein n=1 Tax=Gossypium barbadense TaxID=3634 RepID=A0A2P5YCX0_GOSBA|nr:hypothetical protein GOBAR_AA07131 [Gossypium barbadense]
MPMSIISFAFLVVLAEIAFNVVYTRKENFCTCLEEVEGSVIFRGSNHENSSPSPAVSPGPQEELFQILRARPLIAGCCIDRAAIEQVQMVDAIWALLTTNPWELLFGIIETIYLELRMELCSTFHLQTVMTNYDDPGMVQFRLGGLVRQLSIPEFGVVVGLYTEELKEENELHALTRHIHFSPSKCWHTLAPSATSYNHSLSKASVLPPSLSQMSPQGILSILSMRMIERRRGTYPPQYHLAQSTEEEAYKDILDDVPLQHEDPPTQPPAPSRPVHVATSYADISEILTRFE